MPNRRPKCARRQPGFTLLELMVVIVIIGLVGGITAVAVMDALRDARIKTTRETIRGWEVALKLYAVRHTRYPDTSQGLAVLVAERLVDKDKKPVDSWGRDLVYTGERDKYVITSYGEDGAPGGEGADADIVAEGGR